MGGIPRLPAARANLGPAPSILCGGRSAGRACGSALVVLVRRFARPVGGEQRERRRCRAAAGPGVVGGVSGARARCKSLRVSFWHFFGMPGCAAVRQRTARRVLTRYGVGGGAAPVHILNTNQLTNSFLTYSYNTH